MMTDAELLAAVEIEEKNALGWGDGELSFERETMLRYYNQEPYGNEVEGRSQIVTSEVQDTVEWMLPTLLRVFTGSDKAVEFTPQGPEDEESAEQATDACNYVFYRQNPGFTILYQFFKDALIQKNGYVKVYYEDTERTKREKYQGLTDMDLAMLLKNESVKVVEHTAYQIGPNGWLEVEDSPQPEMKGGKPEVEENAQNAASQLHDVVVEITEPYGKVCIDPVPPEEILVAQDLRDVNVQKANFFAHRRKMTISELNEMGLETDGIGSDDSWVDISGEAQARRQFDEEIAARDGDSPDPSMRKVWVTEAYIRVDLNGDGKAELVKVFKTAKKVLEKEEVEVIPFAAITPIIMSHRHFGKSLAEIVAELQLVKSTITRQVLDNVYLTNSPRQAVLSNTDGAPMANLDDLLTVRPGGIVREFAPNAVRNLDIPFMGAAGIQMMEYLDTVKENRTGVTRYNQGIDSNSLNKTATGISQIMNASQQRIELVARIFAETGVKQLFRLILMNLSMYHGRELVIRLNNEWTAYDPRNWNTEMDMTVNVGLGNGNKDQQLVHLNQIAQAQFALASAGSKIVNEKNIYNVQAKIAENAGFKSVEEFWTDPDKAAAEAQQNPPPPPPPPPEVMKAQAEMQMAQQKMQMDAQSKQQDAEIKLRTEAQKAQMQREIEQQKLQATIQMEQAKLQLEALKAQAQIEIERTKQQMSMLLEREKAKAQIDLKRDIATVDAHQKAQAQQHAQETERVQASVQQSEANSSESMMQGFDVIAKNLQNGLEAIVSKLNAPRTVLRGPDGRVSGVQ